MQNYRLENKELKFEIFKLKEEIKSKSIPVDNELSSDFCTIMSNVDKSTVPPFINFFWEEQQKYISAYKKGARYHPMIIKYCLGLASKSPAVYDDIRGFLMLPSRRRLREYKNYIRPQQGFNSGVINELSVMVQKFSQQERFSVILIDEMKIQEDLVWDKHTGDLIGYVDLGDTELNYAKLKKSEEVATHMLVFLVRSIVNPLKFALANFATKNVTAVQFFPLFWKAVGILEDKCNLQVVAVTSDGASLNRTMYRMHAKMERVDFSESLDDCVIYNTSNIFVDDDKHRYIFFICDQPHTLKTARNNIAHSGFGGKSSRLLWNDGHYVIWDHVSKLLMEDLECGLQLCPKITIEHVNLTPYSVMNVRLAAQVLSTSVSTALKTFGPEVVGTAIYCEMFCSFFDCLNVRNSTESVTKLKPFLAPYSSVNGERFTWLLDTFLPYFT